MITSTFGDLVTEVRERSRRFERSRCSVVAIGSSGMNGSKVALGIGFQV